MRKKLFKIIATIFLLVYTVITVFPFYVLFIRTFVGTRDSTTIWWWIPPERDISMDSSIASLTQFYTIDLGQFKDDFGITGYIAPTLTLHQLSEQYNIPLERFQNYFKGFGTYNGWLTLVKAPEFWSALWRTVLLTLLSLVGITILSVFTGYGLAGLRRRDQRFIYNIYLIQMVIPPILVIIPQFMMLQGLQNLFPALLKSEHSRYIIQFLTLLLINIKGGAFTTMIFTSSVGALPRDLDEAAQVDGANRWQYFTSILLPLLKVPIASCLVILLPDYWNQFIEPYVYLDPSNTTLLPFIQHATSRFSTNFQVIFTGVFVSVLPLLLVYIVLRRWFIRGAMSGAIKG